MAETWGVGRTLGRWHFSNEGFSSKHAALVDVYRRALNKGWQPVPLREKWWQFWLPKRWEDHDAIVEAMGKSDG